MEKEFDKNLLDEALKDVIHYGKGFVVTKNYLIDTFYKEIISYNEILLVNEPNDGSKYFSKVRTRKLTTIHTLENKYTYETEDYDLLDYIRTKNKNVLIGNDYFNKKKLKQVRLENNSSYPNKIKVKIIKSLFISFSIILFSFLLSHLFIFPEICIVMIPVVIVSELLYIIYV